MLKKILLLLVITLSALFCKAQFYKSILPSPEFTSALEKIVLDFRLNFRTIEGDSLGSLGDAEMYASTIKLPGADECVIYRYHSVLDSTASWQGVMYRGEDYKEAVRVYQNVFRLVKKSQIHWIDRTIIGFTGSMEQPKEAVRFATSTLDFDLEDPRYKRFKAEISLATTYSGFEVHLNLETKKPDKEGKFDQ